MKPQIVFFSELLGPSLIINLAQLVSPSVALPAELVHKIKQYSYNTSFNTEHILFVSVHFLHFFDIFSFNITNFYIFID